MKSKFLIGIKYLFQLGLRPLALYALYKFGLLTGHYKRLTPIFDDRNSNIELPNIVPLFSLPNRDQLSQILGEEGKANLLKEADEIVNGKVRIFGEPVLLQFTFEKPLSHWTEYETHKTPLPDSPHLHRTQGRCSLFPISNFFGNPPASAGHLHWDAPIISRKTINTPKRFGNILKPSHKTIPQTSVRIG